MNVMVPQRYDYRPPDFHDWTGRPVHVPTPRPKLERPARTLRTLLVDAVVISAKARCEPWADKLLSEDQLASMKAAFEQALRNGSISEQRQGLVARHDGRDWVLRMDGLQLLRVLPAD
ncbi:hypothetical protein [Streptomyces mirabilis]|uniref:hypothetical protein n=1 Tax=Streptomyces mirabilis TaxID=68239 RepID=UPI0036C170A5